MERSLKDLAALVGAEVVGDASVVIHGLSSVDEAGPDELTFIDSDQYLPLLRERKPGAVILKQAVEDLNLPQVVASDPRMAFFTIAALVSRMEVASPGISDRAFIDPGAEVDEGASIAPLVYVGPGVKVGSGTVLHPGVVLECDCTVGNDCVLHAGVCIGSKVRIGDRVILHYNVGVGADGFGYLQRDGMNMKVPQLGGVVIESDVEVGAGSTIDRGTLGNTVIGEGTKIDNLVQVAHNCRIGKHVILVAQCGLGGSTIVEDYAMIGPHSGTVDHVKVGRGAMVGGMSGVHHDVAPGAKIIGVPAIEHHVWKRNSAYFSKLGDMTRRVRELEKRLAALEENGADNKKR